MTPIRRNVLLAGECRFQLGGPADYFAAVADAAQLQEALAFARAHSLRVFVYSGGSNLFFADAGFRGLVIRVTGGTWSTEKQMLRPSTYLNRERSSPRDGTAKSKAVTEYPATVADCASSVPVVTVSAGYDLPTLVRELASVGLGGIEFLGNIPGSVGGAVVGNAGCYGRAIAELLVAAQVYDIDEDRVIAAPPEFFKFSYRHSKLKFDPRYVVLGATLRLVPRPTAEVLAEVEGELALRLSKHPHFAACAGSFFKNPPGYPAWKVIADAGLNDASNGGARLHKLHANFLVNEGGTSTDVLALARFVMTTAQRQVGIELEPEVRYVGEHGIEPI